MRLNLKLNRIVKTLLAYGFLFWGSWGLITPILAVFILDNIQNGDVRVVGIASAVYWAFRSLSQTPIGIILDEKGGKRPAFCFLQTNFSR